MSRGRFFLPATAQCAFIRSITTIDGPFLAQTARSIECSGSVFLDTDYAVSTFKSSNSAGGM
jgi:hypothetical protein